MVLALDILVQKVLRETLEEAKKVVETGNTSKAGDLTLEEITWLAAFTTSPENRRGVLTVLITSLAKKIARPEQDIRAHQDNLPGGYSGRGLDTSLVTPFLRAAGFPAMKESGWLTRSLEQPHPYDKKYPGKITPTALKAAFLNLIAGAENNPLQARTYLLYILTELERFRQLQKATPVIKLPENIARRLPVATIVDCLQQHFDTSYPKGVSGAARLPVLALYSAYQCLIEELARFQAKQLLPLESHTSPDVKSGRIGDIDIVDTSNIAPFEGIEVKFGIPITFAMVETTFNKIKNTGIQRYYILSTADVKEDEQVAISTYVNEKKVEQGCEMIVNGVMPSLKYYLRLVQDVTRFLEYYADNLQVDAFIKREHREKWNQILSFYS